MNLSFFAYIDDSTDDYYPSSVIVEMKELMAKGDKMHVVTENGYYDLIGLDAITYKDEADLKIQVNTILKELGV